MFGANSARVADVYAWLSNTYNTQQKLEEAEKFSLMAIPLYEKSKHNWELSNVLHDYGGNLFLRHKFHQAEQYLVQALQIRKKLLGPVDPQVQQTDHQLAMVRRVSRSIGK